MGYRFDTSNQEAGRRSLVDEVNGSQYVQYYYLLLLEVLPT